MNMHRRCTVHRHTLTTIPAKLYQQSHIQMKIYLMGVLSRTPGTNDMFDSIPSVD